MSVEITIAPKLIAYLLDETGKCFCGEKSVKRLAEVQENSNKRYTPVKPFYLCMKHLEEFAFENNKLLKMLYEKKIVFVKME